MYMTIYSGDVIILEDDCVPSPDFIEVAWALHHLKSQRHDSVVAALAGWGGEQLLNANPHTFVVQLQRDVFPNMGYIVNKSLTDYVDQWKVSLNLILY